MLEPAPVAPLAEACDALRFRALRFVNVALARPLVSENTWMYVADPRYRISRIQEPKHRSPFMAPQGCTSLMLEVPCNVGDSLWSASDAEILELTLAELEHLGFSLRADLAAPSRPAWRTDIRFTSSDTKHPATPCWPVWRTTTT